MTEPAATNQATALTESSVPTVDEDLNCLLCNYNLRTLPHGASCPECQTPVLWTMHGDIPVIAKPAWIMTLMIATVLMAVTVLLMCLMKFAEMKGMSHRDFLHAQMLLCLFMSLGGILLAWPQAYHSVWNQGQYFRRFLMLCSLILLTCVVLQPMWVSDASNALEAWILPNKNAISTHQVTWMSRLPQICVRVLKDAAQAHVLGLTNELFFRLCIVLGLVYLRRISRRIHAEHLQVYTWCLLGLIMFLIWLQGAKFGAEFLILFSKNQWINSREAQLWMAAYLSTAVLLGFFAKNLWRARTQRLTTFAAEKSPQP